MAHAWSWLRARARGCAPQVLQLLAEHACGEDRTAELERLSGVEEALAAILANFDGSARARLSRLARSLGFTLKWQQRTLDGNPEERREAIARLGTLSWGAPDSILIEAMRDEDGAVRLEAARALLAGGVPRNVEHVFATALAQAAEARAELAPALQKHALLLAETALPEALSSEDAARLAAVLELVESWGRALPIPSLAPLLRHAQASVRARALRAALYDSSMCPLEPQVLRALGDESAEVRAAACAAAARLRLECAVPAVVQCLRQAEPALAQAAAAALAEMGPAGLAALENEMRLAWEPATAAAALAAVEQVRTERYGYARL